jgi:soluble lytic murein transglycosylase-like protein
LHLRLKYIFVTALAVCALGGSTSAEAQIYSWKDANGILVVSNVPRGGASTGGHTATLPQLTARVAPPLRLNSSSDYERLIHEHSALQGVRADLVRAVIQVESAFNPRAISPKGAMGLMQLMPATAARFGVIDAFNPAENIRGGVSYLKQLLDRYANNEQLALAAYNAGPLAVDKHGSQVPPYKETQDYVRRINALRGLQGAPGITIYKWTDIVDGRPVARYSNVKPANGNYQELPR